MDEAAKKQKRISRKRQAGQAMVEFLLILLVALFFTRLVYFHPQYGFKGMLDRMMLRLGSYLEKDLKAAARPGGNGQAANDPFAGTDAWIN
jgi:hypothetical protein